jgi:hypothetical protein
MGLDASVMCNCYRDRRAKPLTIPGTFIVDEDGFPAIDLPDPDNEAMLDAFDEWLATCCEHPNMDFAAVYLANWRGYQSFLEALGQAGWEHFPVLQDELPEANEGQMAAPAAVSALAELDYFKNHVGNLKKTFLVNSETNEPIGAFSTVYNGMIGRDGRTGMTIGFDENGFFISDAWEMHRELFRAKRFEQRVLEPESLDRPQQFEYVDLDSDRRFVCSTPVRVFAQGDLNALKQEYPRRMHVEQRGIDVDYFSYILEPLTLILRASVETGNPVRWS